VFVNRGRGTTLMSLEIKTAYYGAIDLGTDVLVEGWVERMGGRSAFLEGRVIDAQGAVVAKATSTASVRSSERGTGRREKNGS